MPKGVRRERCTTGDTRLPLLRETPAQLHNLPHARNTTQQILTISHQVNPLNTITEHTISKHNQEAKPLPRLPERRRQLLELGPRGVALGAEAEEVLGVGLLRWVSTDTGGCERISV